MTGVVAVGIILRLLPSRRAEDYFLSGQSIAALLGVGALASGGALYSGWGRINFDEYPQGEPAIHPVFTPPQAEAAK